MYKRIRKIVANYIPTIIKTGLLTGMPGTYRLFEIKASSCNILITNRCNLRCVMCRQWRQPSGRELSADEWKKIIQDFKKNGIKNVHFSGGEPLLRGDLEDLISFSRRNGLTVGLTTNGMLLDEGRLDGLIKAGLRSVVVSIDALGDEYAKIRGISGSFAKVEESAILISNMKKRKGIDASVNFTLMKDTIRHFEDVKDLADSLSLPVSVCLLDKNSSIFQVDENRETFWIRKNKEFDRFLEILKAAKRKKPKSLLLSFPAIGYIERYFDDPRQGKIPCVSSQDRINIDPYGNLLGGCYAMGAFGNLKDRPLADLRKETRYRAAKKNMFYKRCAGCSCGYPYNIRCMPKLVIEDILTRLRYALFKNAI
ncbi:MAG: radical SAM protein [Candidatus Omnitrophota bacterium]